MKFVFIVVATGSLPSEDIATFGGVNGTVLLIIYFVALDLYISTSREIHNKDALFYKLISNQIVVSSFLFMAVSAFLLFMDYRVGSAALWMLIFLLIGELISQEFYRLNISFGDYTKANILFFIKTGGWTTVSSAGIVIGVVDDINDILCIWLIGSVLAIIYGWLSVRKYLEEFIFCPDVNIFCEGLRKNLTIFSSSLSLIVISNIDKVYLANFAYPDKVAAYIFFASIAGASTTLIYTGVVNPNYAKITKLNISEQEVRRVVLRIAIASIGLLCVVGISLSVLIDPLLNFVGRTYLSSEKFLLILISVSVLANCLSLIPHFYLLAHKMDTKIAVSSIASLVVHLGSIHPFYVLWGVDGVAISVSAGFFSMFLMKSYFSIKMIGLQ